MSLCDASDETPEGRNGEHCHVTGLDFLKFGTVGFCHIKQQGSERAALLTEEHTQHLECVHEETQHYCCYRCQSCDGVIASQATIVAKYTRSYTCDWTVQGARQTGCKDLQQQLVEQSHALHYSTLTNTSLPMQADISYRRYPNHVDLRLFEVHFNWPQSNKATAICKADWPLSSYMSFGLLTVPGLAGLNCSKWLSQKLL